MGDKGILPLILACPGGTETTSTAWADRSLLQRCVQMCRSRERPPVQVVSALEERDEPPVAAAAQPATGGDGLAPGPDHDGGRVRSGECSAILQRPGRRPANLEGDDLEHRRRHRLRLRQPFRRLRRLRRRRGHRHRRPHRSRPVNLIAFLHLNRNPWVRLEVRRPWRAHSGRGRSDPDCRGSGHDLRGRRLRPTVHKVGWKGDRCTLHIRVASTSAPKSTFSSLRQ